MRRALIGNILSPDGSLRRSEVVIEDGRIVSVSEEIGEAADVRREDFGDGLLLPGAIDAHVHCLSESGEGISAGTAAAAAGGVTTIIEMPFDGTGPINSAERLLAKTERVREEAHIDVALLGTVEPEGGWEQVGDMVRAGAVGFKVSTFDTESFRFPRSRGHQLRRTMRAIAEANSIVCVHAENDEIIRALLEGPDALEATDHAVHGRVRPPLAEELGVAEALAIATEAGARLHLCHLSTPRAVRLANWYGNSEGADVSVETCPHYLLFTDADVMEQGPRLKINPPIRDDEMRQGLWSQLADGRIDIVSSDHAPWAPERKTRPRMLDNSSGAPGVETIYASMIDAALRRGADMLVRVVEALTRIPAERFALPGKGRIAPGFDADIAVYDAGEPWTIDESELHSNAGWSPYHGRTLSGRIVRTVSRGVDVWDGDTLTAGPGHGRFVQPVREQ